MPAHSHPDYREENERCCYTLDYVEKALVSIREKKSNVDNYLDKVKRHFNAESSQDYIDVIVNTALQGSMDLKFRGLIKARSKPYFARLDFKEEGKENAEKLYIGKMCLARDEDQHLIIIDWRAPVSNLYYEGRLGESSYLCPDGTVTGDILLKRQFSINGGVLQEILDIDITTNDEFLQSHLGANADNRLKDIVSTIQAEQNKIIREDMWTPLVVQGAAGSGKTTIALHRIAYLIYSFEKTFEPENFMIIAPNKMFLNYISDILPELGVERVKQTTFEEFAMEIIGKKFKLGDSNDKLVAFVDHSATPQQSQKGSLIRRASELKSSMVFKDMIDAYIREVEQSFIPEEDFKLGNIVLFKYKEIKKLFIEDYKNWPVMHRINEIKKYLSNRLKAKRDSIINRIQDDCYEKIEDLKLNMKECDERQRQIVELIDRKNETLDKIDSYSKKAVNEYIGKISKISAVQYYRNFIEHYLKKLDTETLFGVDKDLVEFVCGYTLEILKSGTVEVEDFAPIIHLKYLIYGMDEKIPVKHIVIDEGQDFSVFQFYVLKKIIKDSSFTILGDLSQGIHSYRGTRDWDDVMKHVFSDRRGRLLTLEQSYRTTIEIMDAANKVIVRLKDIDDKYKSLVTAKPVIRHGEKVQVIKKTSIGEIAAEISGKINGLKKIGYVSFAIICKTGDECKEMLSALKKLEKDAYILTGKEDEYKSGIVIVPSYLSKGLEFDAVMIANASSSQYKEDELDIKLLYVAMTRPLHLLDIYYCGEPSPLLEGI